jgi:hypothetical protein
MKRNRIVKHQPEQKVAEKLLQVLGAVSTEDGVEKAQQLVRAVLAEPLVLAVSISRATGQFALTTNVQETTAADDLRLLHEAALALSKQLSEEMVKVASQKPSPTPAKNAGPTVNPLP